MDNLTYALLSQKLGDNIVDTVEDWLEDHPEATTTVQDGAISYSKLNSSLQGTVDDVGALKSQITALDAAVEQLDAGSLSALGATAGQVPVADGQGAWAWGDPVQTETVTGSTPSITAQPGVRYICGEVSTLAITVPATGIIDVVFESGSTPTVLTVTPPSGVTAVKWANGFDPTALEADTVYEINIMDGEYGVVGAWT